MLCNTKCFLVQLYKIMYLPYLLDSFYINGTKNFSRLSIRIYGPIFKQPYNIKQIRNLQLCAKVCKMNNTFGDNKLKYGVVENERPEYSQYKEHHLHVDTDDSLSSSQKEQMLLMESSTLNQGMCADTYWQEQIKRIFHYAIKSVMPRCLLQKAMSFEVTETSLHVGGKTYKMHHNVYVVGFGKAALGMARAVDDMIGDHIVKGIVSIPFGSINDYKKYERGDLMLLPDSKILVHEGAAFNLPDENAHRAALDIYHMVLNCCSCDIVIVLISGGGSTLLPLPINPLSIEDLLLTTKELFNHGANILEVNSIRSQIEVLKGGGLAEAAMPAQVISVILSDVIGDRLEMISSGPTMRKSYSPSQCLEVIRNLNVLDILPENVIKLLRMKEKEPNFKKASEIDRTDWDRVCNVLVGSNTVSCKAAAFCAEQLGVSCYVLSTELTGQAVQVGKVMACLAKYICICGDRSADYSSYALVTLELDLSSFISKAKLNKICELVTEAASAGMSFCIVAGGETTVTVKGNGNGGRNQEMAISAGLHLHRLFSMGEHHRKPYPSIFFLSAGTDGQDGPTNAAGAIVDDHFVSDARLQGLDPLFYLDNNDSNTLWTHFSGGRGLIMTGLTGTNVMDIQILEIDRTDWDRVCNVLVGSNTVSCKAAAFCAEQLGVSCYVLSTELTGQAVQVGKVMACLAKYICICGDRSADYSSYALVTLELDLSSFISKAKLNKICELVTEAASAGMSFCIVAGGETTVTVKGNGNGGRNQEMAISAGLHLHRLFSMGEHHRKPYPSIFFLSAGTDGQDGPTNAAGAIVDDHFVSDARLQGLDPLFYLDNNDSNTLWTHFSGGRGLIMTGLTGTNVMDIQILLVKL